MITNLKVLDRTGNLMKFVFYTNSVSPHQLPLARELIKIFGEDGYRYIYTNPFTDERRNIGWDMANERWLVAEFEDRDAARRMLENADVVLSSERDWNLFETRAKKGLLSIYVSERWCKPPIGILRFLTPRYFMYAWRLAKLMLSTDKVLYFPIGIHAARDMARLCGLVRGDLRCLFRAPRLEFEKRPGARIIASRKPIVACRRYCLDKMRMWGYYVAPPKRDALQVQEATKTKPHEIKVLWVGRLLNLKRVDDSLPKMTLDIYGMGSEESRLRDMAKGYDDEIRFYPPVPIDEVRKLMREHDVYVLASNAYEGWGAVVSEALEEGMGVVGTYEAGSSATMLPRERLFHAGDWKTLMKLLSDGVGTIGIGSWSASSAAMFIQRLTAN